MHDRSGPRRNPPPDFAPDTDPHEMLGAAPDVVFCTDAWGRLLWASFAFEVLTGRSVQECVGTPCAGLLVADQVSGLVRAVLKLERRGGGVHDRALTIVRPDGSMRQVEARLRFVRRVDGRRYLVGVARAGASAGAAPVHEADTDRRVHEMEHSLDEARRQARVKGELLATMSHGIRTTVRGVIEMADQLLKGHLPPEPRQLVEMISQNGEALARLVDDTLDYSRLEAGRMPVERLDFDLRVAVDQVSGVVRTLAEAKSLAFGTRISALVPSRLQGDPGRLRQVLLNLGSNAVKFTDDGGVNLRIEREAEDDQHVTLTFMVSDTGVGIEPAAQRTLFEPYAQADASIARRFGGSGLGLAISKRLVEAMGGEVGLESLVGRGSTFWIRLKFEKQPQVVSEREAPDDEVSLRGVRVLVADTRAEDRDPLVEALQAWGCDVAGAANGPEALGMILDAASAGRPYALAMLDQNLELLAGEEVAQAVRADPKLAATRLVMVTNAGRPGDAGRVKAAGFAGYLMKPLESAQLYEALGAVLGSGGHDGTAAERPLVTRHSLAEARRGKLRLLLVDDDLVNQLVTTSALHRVGYNIVVANSGRRAIELTENQRWDLILMDMQMPDMDGCRATAAIRARERGAWRTPILGLTANADYEPDRDRCLAAGMDLVLGKPYDLETLTTTVERFTSRDGRPLESDRPSAPKSPPRLTVVSTLFELPGVVTSPAASSQSAGPAPGPDVATPAKGAAREVPVMPEGPAIDMEQLETTCMGLPALRITLLHTFLGDVSARLERLSQAFAAADARRVEFESHGLKGMCATIGAGGCTTLFAEIEELSRDDRVDEARVFLQPGIDEVRRTEDFIRRLDSILTRDVA